ncbi:TMEM175 family protein [Candidatus Nitrosocosmicus sp. R]
MVLGFWIAHEDQFHYIKRAIRILFWITIFYLTFIVFMPFSNSN